MWCFHLFLSNMFILYFINSFLLNHAFPLCHDRWCNDDIGCMNTVPRYSYIDVINYLPIVRIRLRTLSTGWLNYSSGMSTELHIGHEFAIAWQRKTYRSYRRQKSTLWRGWYVCSFLTTKAISWHLRGRKGWQAEIINIVKQRKYCTCGRTHFLSLFRVHVYLFITEKVKIDERVYEKKKSFINNYNRKWNYWRTRRNQSTYR